MGALTGHTSAMLPLSPTQDCSEAACLGPSFWHFCATWDLSLISWHSAYRPIHGLSEKNERMSGQTPHTSLCSLAE